MTFKEELQLRNEVDELMQTTCTEESIYRVLSVIQLLKEDDEVAHGIEDDMRDWVLKAIDNPLAKLALTSSKICFSRWCA